MLKSLRIILFLPFSWLYGAIVFVRNRFFDWGIFTSEAGAVRTIVLGNLSAGGTGKTPHTEYFAKLLLKEKINFGILSRGYGRLTKGFLEVNSRPISSQVGDEPSQFAYKLKGVPIAVCENRIDGIKKMTNANAQLQLVLLDDAFQHRHLNGDLNILLTTYSNPFWSDMMLPSGYLRDNKREKRRANVFIVSKCPQNLSPDKKTGIIHKIKPFANQHVFFSSERMMPPQQLFGPPIDPSDVKAWIGFAGIAGSATFVHHLQSEFSIKKFKNYPDHHPYQVKDIEVLRSELSTFVGLSPAAITTEKDAMRLMGLKELIDFPVFIVPLEIWIDQETELENVFRKFLGKSF